MLKMEAGLMKEFFPKGPSIYDVHKKLRFLPPLPLSTWAGPPSPLVDVHTHEIHTALLKWLVQ